MVLPAAWVKSREVAPVSWSLELIRHVFFGGIFLFFSFFFSDLMMKGTGRGKKWGGRSHFFPTGKIGTVSVFTVPSRRSYSFSPLCIALTARIYHLDHAHAHCGILARQASGCTKGPKLCFSSPTNSAPKLSAQEVSSRRAPRPGTTRHGKAWLPDS